MFRPLAETRVNDLHSYHDETSDLNATIAILHNCRGLTSEECSTLSWATTDKATTHSVRLVQSPGKISIL